MKENKIKLFVAIPVPEDLKKELTFFVDTNSHISNIRWVPEQNYHLTLFFIGFINEKKLEIINSKINNLISNSKPFNLFFEKYSLEGKPSKASMIWCRFQHSSEFEIISAQIATEIKNELEHVQDFKRAIPHITLARLRKSVKRKEINLELQPVIKEIKVYKCQLWQSIGTTSGMVYKNLSEYKFAE